MHRPILRPILRMALFLPPLALLAGCGSEPTAQEEAADAARQIALVEKANATIPPPEPVQLQPISYADLERHDLLSAPGCSVAPGTSLATRAIARPVDAYVKIDGEMLRLAVDPGASELPGGARTRYLGRTHELRLRLDGDGKPSGNGKVDYQGTAKLLDEHGRLVYEGSGLTQCGE